MLKNLKEAVWKVLKTVILNLFQNLKILRTNQY